MQTMCIDDNVHENSSKAVTKELPSFHGKAEQLCTQLSSQHQLQFGTSSVSTGAVRQTAVSGRSMTSWWIICYDKGNQ